MTPNYMKYQSFCYNVPQVILSLFRLGMCGAVSLHHHGGTYMAICHDAKGCAD